MARAWQTLATVPTAEGALSLRQRGENEFLIMIGGRVLMTSVSRRSEEALASLACQSLTKQPAPRVLIGGLGMGFTLRAALSALPPAAQVIVAELNADVVSWCQGPLAALTENALADRRVRVEIGDVARLIAHAAPSTYDAILLDLYEGPHAATQKPNDPFYGPAALRRSYAALKPEGVLAIWSEDADSSFARRLSTSGFVASTHRLVQGSRAHYVYIGVSGSYCAESRAADLHPPRRG